MSIADDPAIPASVARLIGEDTAAVLAVGHALHAAGNSMAARRRYDKAIKLCKRRAFQRPRWRR